MNNIKQVTNFSTEVTSATTEIIQIYIGNKAYISVEYYVLPASILTGSADTPIIKLGYVCEPKGIDYPIVISAGGQTNTFYIGKTGMFEVMPEIFKNVNDEEAVEVNCLPQITEIKVPKGIAGDEPLKFKLDYVFSIS